MPWQTYHFKVIRAYFLHMIIQNSIDPEEDVEELVQQLELEKEILEGICNTHYLQGCVCVPKKESLSLAWEFAQNSTDHQQFINMLHVSPQVFQTLLHLIEDHPVFQNNSNNPQTEVEKQLAVTLYWMRCFRNGTSLEDIARISGVSEGSVENVTECCFKAIEDLHDLFVRALTHEEKSGGWMSIWVLLEHGGKVGWCMMAQLWFYARNQVLMGMHIIPINQIMGSMLK